MIAGTKAFIEKDGSNPGKCLAGMRQAGVIAGRGAGLRWKSLRCATHRFTKMRAAGEGIAESGLHIDPKKVRSEHRDFDCSKTGKTAVELCDALHPHGVWAQDTALYSVRVVTHCDVDRAGIVNGLSRY